MEWRELRGRDDGWWGVQRNVVKMRERNKREESSVMEYTPDNSFEKNGAGGGRSWHNQCWSYAGGICQLLQIWICIDGQLLVC